MIKTLLGNLLQRLKLLQVLLQFLNTHLIKGLTLNFPSDHSTIMGVESALDKQGVLLGIEEDVGPEFLHIALLVLRHVHLRVALASHDDLQNVQVLDDVVF